MTITERNSMTQNEREAYDTGEAWSLAYAGLYGDAAAARAVTIYAEVKPTAWLRGASDALLERVSRAQARRVNDAAMLAATRGQG